MAKEVLDDELLRHLERLESIIRPLVHSRGGGSYKGLALNVIARAIRDYCDWSLYPYGNAHNLSKLRHWFLENDAPSQGSFLFWLCIICLDQGSGYSSVEYCRVRILRELRLK